MNADGTASGAAQAALEQAINTYIQDQASRDELITAVRNLKDGKEIDIGNVGSALGRGILIELVDDSNLSEDEKKIVKGLIGEITGEEGAFTNAGFEILEEKMIKAGISPEDAQRITDAARHAFKTGDVTEVFDVAKTILVSKLEKAIDKQLNKLYDKFPFLKEIFKDWGIDAASITKLLTSFNLENILQTFRTICNMSLEDWKNIGKQILNYYKDKAITAICNFAEKAIDKLLASIYNKVMKHLSKIKALDDYIDIIRIAGSVLKDTISIEAKRVINEGRSQLRNMWNNSSSNGQ